MATSESNLEHTHVYIYIYIYIYTSRIWKDVKILLRKMLCPVQERTTKAKTTTKTKNKQATRKCNNTIFDL